MQRRFTTALALVVTTTVAAAQDLLLYKFESGCNAEAINFGASSPAPATGNIITNLAGAPAASWTSGRFGSALKGASVVAPQTHNYVDTGWNPGNITGSMTWACWVQMDPAAPTPSLTYLFGNGTTFRVFTGGGGFFLTSGWGGSNVNTVANVQTLARAGWTHIACVLDGTALTGTYYINGVPENPVALTTQVNWTGVNFFVGKYGGLTNANIFDLDEFILVNRAMTLPEIVALASASYGADGTFGSSCGPTLAGNGQRPTLGNSLYGFQVNGPAFGFAWIVFGTSRCTMQGGLIPLPTDLGVFQPMLAGCRGHVDTDLGAVSSLLGAGSTAVAFPLPALPVLSGYTVYGQGVTVDAAATQLRASNALAVSIGF